MIVGVVAMGLVGLVPVIGGMFRFGLMLVALGCLYRLDYLLDDCFRPDE